MFNEPRGVAPWTGHGLSGAVALFFQHEILDNLAEFIVRVK